jgi:hypothetical protein
MLLSDRSVVACKPPGYVCTMIESVKKCTSVPLNNTQSEPREQCDARCGKRTPEELEKSLQILDYVAMGAGILAVLGTAVWLRKKLKATLVEIKERERHQSAGFADALTKLSKLNELKAVYATHPDIVTETNWAGKTLLHIALTMKEIPDAVVDWVMMVQPTAATVLDNYKNRPGVPPPPPRDAHFDP